MANFCPDISEPTKSQFLRPITNLRISLSIGLLSIGTIGLLTNFLSSSSKYNAYLIALLKESFVTSLFLTCSLQRLKNLSTKSLVYVVRCLSRTTQR